MLPKTKWYPGEHTKKQKIITDYVCVLLGLYLNSKYNNINETTSKNAVIFKFYSIVHVKKEVLPEILVTNFWMQEWHKYIYTLTVQVNTSTVGETLMAAKSIYQCTEFRLH